MKETKSAIRLGVLGWETATHLGRRNDGEGGHHPIGVLLHDLGDQERSHTSTGSTSKRVGDLESLEAVATLGLLANDIEHRVDELSSLSVVTLGPLQMERQSGQRSGSIDTAPTPSPIFFHRHELDPSDMLMQLDWKTNEESSHHSRCYRLRTVRRQSCRA